MHPWVDASRRRRRSRPLRPPVCPPALPTNGLRPTSLARPSPRRARLPLPPPMPLHTRRLPPASPAPRPRPTTSV
eukprot:3699570-Pleurochrysis_carterae.AAC.1